MLRPVTTRATIHLGTRAPLHRLGMVCHAASEDAHLWESSIRWEKWLIEDREEKIPIHALGQAQADADALGSAHGQLAKALAGIQKFKGKSGESLLIPDQAQVQRSHGNRKRFMPSPAP